MLPPFFISLVFFIFVFLMTQILKLTDLIVNFKVSFLDVLLLLFYSAPYFLRYTMPISVMISVFLVVSRMTGDNEIVALKASGISMVKIFYPVLFFCLIGYLILGFMASFAAPWGSYAFKEKLKDLASASAGAAIRERAFNVSFDGVVLYAAKMNIHDKSLENIFIQDRRFVKDGATITAPKGRLINDPEKNQMMLKLFDGMINQVNLKTKAVQAIEFDTYEVNINLEKSTAGKLEKATKGKREMTVFDLYKYCYVEDNKDNEGYDNLVTRFHMMIGFPVSCLLLGCMAFPLGVWSVMSRRTSEKSMGICIAMIVLYYALFGFGYTIGKAGGMSPAIGLWIPNMVLGAAGFWLFARMLRE